MKTLSKLYEALSKDYYGNKIVLPKKGDKYLYDGYKFTVKEVIPDNDVAIVASIILDGDKGQGTKEVGYYDLLKTEKA